MKSLEHEWPSFLRVPEDDELGIARPRSQELARWVWYDGELRESSEVSVHYYANALHYGTAVFEGVRCYPSARGPVLLRLRDHLERFGNSASIYGMALPCSIEQLEQASVEVTGRNGIRDGYLRPLPSTEACSSCSMEQGSAIP